MIGKRRVTLVDGPQRCPRSVRREREVIHCGVKTGRRKAEAGERRRGEDGEEGVEGWGLLRQTAF